MTSEQLRRKAGKVRCGQCQSVFNAFDQWQATANEPTADAPLTETDLPPVADRQAVEDTWAGNELAEAPGESRDRIEECVENSLPEAFGEPEEWVPENGLAPETDEPVVFAAAESVPAADVEVELAQESVPAPLPDPEPMPIADGQPAETPEESTLAAREAGLVAARELSEASSYNRWAAGTLTGDGLGGFGNEPARRAVWPFVLVSVLLVIVLLLQLLYYFRTEVVQRVPAAAALYELAAVDIPLPRNPALVSIETSDLQSDNARGLFVLQASLKNGAAYPQAWPALELSLTDTNDSVVARRVMYAAEYLPPGTTSDAFPANGEVAVQLWIEARNIGASGYRLYLFYP